MDPPLPPQFISPPVDDHVGLDVTSAETPCWRFWLTLKCIISQINASALPSSGSASGKILLMADDSDAPLDGFAEFKQRIFCGSRRRKRNTPQPKDLTAQVNAGRWKVGLPPLLINAARTVGSLVGCSNRTGWGFCFHRVDAALLPPKALAAGQSHRGRRGGERCWMGCYKLRNA